MNSPPILYLIHFCFPILDKKVSILRSLRKDMHHMLLENIQTRVCYTGTKLGTKINNVKD